MPSLSALRGLAKTCSIYGVGEHPCVTSNGSTTIRLHSYEYTSTLSICIHMPDVYFSTYTIILDALGNA